MEYENPLDQLLHRFQDRWETSSQYRATMSGVLGLVLILFLCTGVGVVNAVASNMLATVGVTSSGTHPSSASSLDTGVSRVNGSPIFPTPEVTITGSNAIPVASPIANSATPYPTPTPSPTPTFAPTATPCRVNCGSPHPGGTVNLIAHAPATWISGQAATLTLQTSAPNTLVNIIIKFPHSTVLSQGNGGPSQTGADSTVSWTFAVPGGSCDGGGSASVTYFAYYGTQVYGPTATIPCS